MRLFLFALGGLNMNKLGRVVWLSFILLLFAVPAAWPRTEPQGARQHPQEKEGVLVGRISYVEGEILRYVPEQKDWVLAVKDSPFGLEDALYSGNDGKAEFLMPNSTWIRIGANTQVQMIALKGDATEIDVASGMARFEDRSSKAVIKATTPFGYVVAEPGSAFDLYVGDESVEVIGIRGNVDFIHDADGAKYEVVAGAMSILADNRQATAGEGKVDGEWDDWNTSRDTVLTQNIETRGESVKYLPEGIREDSRVLDENGRWERVYYEGQYREVWRPSHVEPDWAPYTVGRWTDWYGDQCWIPAEPFGYVTHHYGYWFSANNYWYWAPPVVSVGIGGPFGGIGFGWYPGRVGWLYSDAYIGWYPLLAWEPFYCNRWWGPWGFHNYGVVNININRYRNYQHATFVNHGNFYGVNNYHGVRERNVNRGAIGSQFHATPVLHNAALRNTGGLNQRYSFTNANPTARPNQSVTSRVAQNQSRFSQAASGVSGRSIRQQSAAMKISNPSGSGVSAPKLTSKFSGGSSGAGQSRALMGNPRSLSRSAQTYSGKTGSTLGNRSGSGTSAMRSGGSHKGFNQGAGSSAAFKSPKTGGSQNYSNSHAHSNSNSHAYSTSHPYSNSHANSNSRAYSNSSGSNRNFKAYNSQNSFSKGSQSYSKGSQSYKGDLSGRQRLTRGQYGGQTGGRSYGANQGRYAQGASRSGARGGYGAGTRSGGFQGHPGGSAYHGQAGHAPQVQGGKFQGQGKK